jgi:hypothetical protein
MLIANFYVEVEKKVQTLAGSFKCKLLACKKLMRARRVLVMAFNYDVI